MYMYNIIMLCFFLREINNIMIYKNQIQKQCLSKDYFIFRIFLSKISQVDLKIYYIHKLLYNY